MNSDGKGREISTRLDPTRFREQMRFHNWPRVGTMGCFGPPRTKLPDAASAHLERIVGIVGESYRGPAKCLLISDIGEVQ